LMFKDIPFKKLQLGNLDAMRDWGYAKEYASMVVDQVINTKYLKDFMLCTEEAHSVRDFVREAFNLIGVKNWEDFVEIDESLKRPKEVPYLRGQCSLKEKPKVKFKELIRIMLEHEIQRLGLPSLPKLEKESITTG
ncbi:MAG: GDP-mannose 4,6-dehydratase, partial [Candidatus Thorarchaeota archaeon]